MNMTFAEVSSGGSNISGLNEEIKIQSWGGGAPQQRCTCNVVYDVSEVAEQPIQNQIADRNFKSKCQIYNSFRFRKEESQWFTVEWKNLNFMMPEMITGAAWL